MNKIEAAERLAESVEEYISGEHKALTYGAMRCALAAYRSASVPSDEELGRVAYATTGLTAQYEWNDLTEVQRRKWTAASAAVREWVQRDGLDDAEREVIVDAMQAYLVGDPKCEPARSILRKLGHEPEPVWEWDAYNSMWMLGGSTDGDVFPCAEVKLVPQGCLGVVSFSEIESHNNCGDSVAQAKAWCEKQLREANLKGANNEQD